MKEKLEQIRKKIEEYSMNGKKARISDDERCEILLSIEEVVEEADDIIEYADYLRKKLRKIKTNSEFTPISKNENE